MRRLLLATTAIIGILSAGPAAAEPVSLVVALISGGATFGAAMTAVFGTVGVAVMQLGLSLLLGTVARNMAGKPKQDAQRAELARPAALPAYRYVYGSGWAPGTPVGWTVVGETLYICWLLNSRPSVISTHTILFDKRTVAATGNPFDFAGPGAVGVNSVFGGNHVRYWIGRGEQTTCPADIVSGSGGYFEATDAWRGRTVVWAKLHAGSNSEMRERWPSQPPELNVEGDWSLVWDPRDDSYSASSNQAMVALDALMNNPIRPYDPAYLRIDSFIWAADVADEAVAVKGGGTIPRYRADGVLVWGSGSELEDQIEPLLAAGGSSLVRIGGRLGIVPAVARPSVHTIRDFTDGQAIEMVRWQSGDDVYSECVATYVAPDRAYEMAEAPVHIVPGAAAEDGGLVRRLDIQLDFVVDHRQAQRLGKIAVMRSRMQRTVAGELFPDAFVLVAGSVASLDLPAPYTSWNRDYEVVQIQPAAGINDDESITLRLPVSLRETSAEIFAWDAETEEKDVEGAVLDPWVGALDPPTNVSLVSGGDAADVTADGVITPRVMLRWTRSNGASLNRYEWQFKAEESRHTGGSDGETTYFWPAEWSEAQIITGDAGFGLTFAGYIVPVRIGRRYRARVKAVGHYGDSGWIESNIATASAPTRVIGLPSILLAVGGAGRVDLTLRQANDFNASQMDLAAGATSSIGSASIISTIPAGANVTVAHTESDLGAEVTRYYWLRARDSLGNVSPWTAAASATTT